MERVEGASIEGASTPTTPTHVEVDPRRRHGGSRIRHMVGYKVLTFARTVSHGIDIVLA